MEIGELNSIYITALFGFFVFVKLSFKLLIYSLPLYPSFTQPYHYLKLMLMLLLFNITVIIILKAFYANSHFASFFFYSTFVKILATDPGTID